MKKRAVVMGATSGLGREVALVLAEKGWTVGVGGRRREVLERLVSGHPNIVAMCVADVTEASATAALDRLIDEMGGLDLYFHSSGVGWQNVGLDMERELATIKTNCEGMARMVGHVFNRFRTQPDSPVRIAVISSIARTKGLGASPAYSASKRFTSNYLEALQQLTAICRLRHISFTDIRPGFVRTPLIEGSNFPMQLDAHRVAQTIVRAVERGKSVVTVDAFYRLLVMLWSLVPRWLWVRLRIS